MWLNTCSFAFKLMANNHKKSFRDEQGWRSGESTRLPPMCPGSILGPGVICGLSLSLVLVVALGSFSGHLIFLPL